MISVELHFVLFCTNFYLTIKFSINERSNVGQDIFGKKKKKILDLSHKGSVDSKTFICHMLSLFDVFLSLCAKFKGGLLSPLTLLLPSQPHTTAQHRLSHVYRYLEAEV